MIESQKTYHHHCHHHHHHYELLQAQSLRYTPSTSAAPPSLTITRNTNLNTSSHQYQPSHILSLVPTFPHPFTSTNLTISFHQYQPSHIFSPVPTFPHPFTSTNLPTSFHQYQPSHILSPVPSPRAQNTTFNKTSHISSPVTSTFHHINTYYYRFSPPTDSLHSPLHDSLLDHHKHQSKSK
ncbi:hypothetical protein E2C01_064541 [Portunus trituberculatus]|uniref:Uncharacterized protein n=1 Tax=Portunus trituberculatus TaxID=210409 RepID=A0A5B7HM37_PORTR|nr:hypothetical protein [Portunus trituberculatus]